MRLLFAGTPPAALPSLEAVLASRHEVAAVLTRPAAQAGRGRRLRDSPVAERARATGLPVLSPARPSEPEFLLELARIAPDCCAVVAYGALIPPAALGVPGHGWVNLHFSLLPAWRGAAPVQHAVLAGDEVTGATTFRLEEGLDTGPVYGVLTERVAPSDTAGALLDRLATAGGRLLVATLDGIEDGALVPVPQSADGVSYAPRLTVETLRVDWTAPAVRVDRLLRAAAPTPGAWTTFRGNRLKLGPLAGPEPTRRRSGPLAGRDAAGGQPGRSAGPDAAGRQLGRPAAPDAAGRQLGPGELAVSGGGVTVGTGTGPVRLGEVRPAGRPVMAAAAWARGARFTDADRLE